MQSKLIALKYIKAPMLVKDYDEIEDEFDEETGEYHVMSDIYFKTVKNKIGMVALIDVDGKTRVSYSLCNRKDQFSRKEGIRIAIERAEKREVENRALLIEESDLIKDFPEHLRKRVVALEYQLLKDKAIDDMNI